MKRIVGSALSHRLVKKAAGHTSASCSWNLPISSMSLTSAELTKNWDSGFKNYSRRFLSSSPPSTSASKQQLPRAPSKRKVSVVSLLAKKRKDQRISVVTAYDYPSALHVGQAGVDICLVGDSLAMVELGHETTQNVTLDTMIHHCEAASRGLTMAVQQGHRRCMLVGDMPFGTYEYQDTDIALKAAYQFVQRGNCDAVKLEVSCARSAMVNTSLLGLHSRIPDAYVCQIE